LQHLGRRRRPLRMGGVVSFVEQPDTEHAPHTHARARTRAHTPPTTTHHTPHTTPPPPPPRPPPSPQSTQLSNLARWHDSSGLRHCVNPLRELCIHLPDRPSPTISAPAAPGAGR
jgi:hypothetical protein